MQGVRFVVCEMSSFARLAQLGSLLRSFQVDVCADDSMGATRGQGQGNLAANTATYQIKNKFTSLLGRVE